jgi:pimeloyl-ACP methyl ester carboxylesterase
MIIYHHGMVVDLHGVIEARRRGYELTSFCKVLARNGYIAFLPIRSALDPLEKQIRFIHKTFAHAKRIKNVDPEKIALIGFSRGALLTLMAAEDGLDAKAISLLAPAPGPTNELLKYSRKAGRIRSPIQILVVSGDHPDILTGSKLLAQSLNHSQKTIDYRMLKLDKMKCRPDMRPTCAHRTFYRVGPYWSIIRRFLNEHVK